MTEPTGPTPGAKSTNVEKTPEPEGAKPALLETPLDPEKPLAKTAIGQILQVADKAKQDPKALQARLKKRKAKKKARKKAKAGEEEPQESYVQEAADNLAHASTKIKIKKDASGNESVEIEMDPTKFNPNEFAKSLTADVKSFNLKIFERTESGSEKLKSERLLFRRILNGRITYAYKGRDGKFYEVEFPKAGRIHLTISPDQLDTEKSRKQIENLMREETIKATQSATEQLHDDLAGDLFVKKDTSTAGGGGGKKRVSGARVSVRPSGGGTRRKSRDRIRVPSSRASRSAPSASDSLLSGYELDSPEVIKGDLQVREEILSESPTGFPVMLNYSEHPELINKPPRLIYYFHGDGKGLGNMRGKDKILADVDALRRRGVNAVLVACEYEKSKPTDDRWDYFKKGDKFDALDDYCLGRFAKTDEAKSDSKFDLVAFSGGYRAVSAILQRTSHNSRINLISLQDATYTDIVDDNISKTTVEFVKNNEQVKLYISTGKSRNTTGNAEQIRDRLKAAGIGEDRLKVVTTKLGHNAVRDKYLLASLAFGAGIGIKTPRKLERLVRPGTDLMASGMDPRLATDVLANMDTVGEFPDRMSKFYYNVAVFFNNLIHKMGYKSATNFAKKRKYLDGRRETRRQFEQLIASKYSSFSPTHVKMIWSVLKEFRPGHCEHICGAFSRYIHYFSNKKWGGSKLDWNYIWGRPLNQSATEVFRGKSLANITDEQLYNLYSRGIIKCGDVFFAGSASYYGPLCKRSSNRKIPKKHRKLRTLASGEKEDRIRHWWGLAGFKMINGRPVAVWFDNRMALFGTDRVRDFFTKPRVLLQVHSPLGSNYEKVASNLMPSRSS